VPWLQDYLAHLQQQLPAMNAQDLPNLLVALVELWVLPEQGWMEKLLAQYQRHWGSMTAQGVSNSLWALGRLQHRPPQAWLLECQAALGGHLGGMSEQELGNSVWALGRLGLAVEGQLSRAIMAELVARSGASAGSAAAAGMPCCLAMQRCSLQWCSWGVHGRCPERLEMSAPCHAGWLRCLPAASLVPSARQL
jgi:hypothetical protein